MHISTLVFDHNAATERAISQQFCLELLRRSSPHTGGSHKDTLHILKWDCRFYSLLKNYNLPVSTLETLVSTLEKQLERGCACRLQRRGPLQRPIGPSFPLFQHSYNHVPLQCGNLCRYQMACGPSGCHRLISILLVPVRMSPGK